jgi:hypothetical protein
MLSLFFHLFIVPSVDTYDGNVGGSSLTWCVRKIVLQCWICDSCFFVYTKWLPIILASSVIGVLTCLPLERNVPKHGEMWYCQC